MSKNLPNRVISNQTRANVRRVELLRRILEVVAKAGRGHLGPALSILDILEVLYGSVMRNYRNLDDATRDRFILSKGHGCLGLYVVLEKYELLQDHDLDTFCSFSSIFGGHPESFELPHIEFSTGSLGHGPSLATGLAMGAKLHKTDSRIYVLIGDGEINEGSVWEAAMHAHKHKLNNLCFIVDNNGMQANGKVEDVVNLEPLKQKWEAFGFSVREVDGHNSADLEAALNFQLQDSLKPKIVIAKTIKGRGLKEAENSSFWHHKAKITREDVNRLLEGLIE